MLTVSMSPPVVHYPVMQKRPKLSLQTSELPITYGTSSRALSTIATPSAAVTPTTLNTFNNTFDLTHRPSPTSTTASPSLTRATSGRDRLTRSQSPRPKRTEPAAYTVNLPYGIKPILKNTPFPRVRTNSISASPRSSTRRVFFPAPKQVEFKTTIEEEIVTKLYTARHSDLLLDVSDSENQVQQDTNVSDDDNNLSEISITTSSEQTENGTSISISSCKRRKCRRNSIELITATDQPSTSALSATTDIAEDPIPPTPASTRKQRKWEWTLAPLPSVSSAAAPDCESDSKSCQKPTSNVPDPEFPISGKCESASACGGAAACQDLPSDSGSLDAYADKITTQPQPELKSGSPKSKTPLLLLTTSIAPPPSSPSASTHPTRRAGSLDTSQRKRKAACLDISNSGTITTMTGLASSGELDSSSAACSADDGKNLAKIEGSALVGQTGSKRRERAATL